MRPGKIDLLYHNMMKIGVELLHIWKPRICAVRLVKIIEKLLFYKGRSHFGSCSSKVSKGRERLSSYALRGRMFSFIEKKRKTSFPCSSSSAYTALVCHVRAQTEEGQKSTNIVAAVCVCLSC